ncbi:MAG: TonB-dependent receptor [Cyclobacteriaceae bacterium]
MKRVQKIIMILLAAFTMVVLVLDECGAQVKYTLSGTITDSESGEALIGATIYLTNLDRGTTTNSYGFYSITIPRADSVGVVFSYLGYAAQIKKIYFGNNIELNVKLKVSGDLLDEVVVEAQRSDENVQRAQMGVMDIPVSKISELPVILGETDILKVVQLLPGVQSGNEGTTGFFVRGGNSDQNLVQLDEATVYNPNHLFGLFSTFNSRALNNVTLIKGGFPAQYGGRLSSILDVTMKEGNNKEVRGGGGIGLITSQFSLEGPLKTERASFIVSARRTYIDLLARPFTNKGNRSNYHFYDINAKLNWQAGPKDRLFLSYFNGRDRAEYKETVGIFYNILFGNSTATLRWNHLFGQKLFLNTSVIYNQYDQNIEAVQNNSFSQVFSGINDISAKTEFQYLPNLSHSIRFGLHYTNHQFLSKGKSEAQSTGNQSLNINAIPAKYFDEFAFYINDEINISKAVSTSLGVRAPAFLSKRIEYYRFEPRATLKVSLTPTSSLKGSYTLMNQFLHLVPSSTASVPTNVWVPTTSRTKPQLSEQYALGYFRNFAQNKYEASIELYYKTMENQVLFPAGNQLVESFDVDTALVYGKGWSKGIELFVKKNTGRLTGWVSYTLSKTDQQFADLNFGQKFPFQYDRRHVISTVGIYNLNKRWTLSSVFTYSSGNAFTLPVGRINVTNGGTLFEGNYFIYEGKNNARLPAYHRLDVSATYKKRRKIFGKEYDSEWVFSFYNLYSRSNPYFVYFYVDHKSEQPKARQVSLLPIIPSVSYNFKF